MTPIVTGLLSGMASLSPGSSSLIPYRSFAETAEMVLDPSQQREVSLPTAVAVDLVAQAASHVIPALFRSAGLVRSLRERSLGERAKSAMVELRSRVQGPPSGDPFFLEVRGEFPTCLLTHPSIVTLRERLARGDYFHTAEIISKNSGHWDSILKPLLGRMLEFAIRHDPSLSRFEAAGHRLGSDPSKVRVVQGLFPAEMFDRVNTRGIVDYDRHFFGKDRLERLGVVVRPLESALGRMIGRLPQGAVLADWGGGAGIFGYEAKNRRPDLKVFVNDLHTPEAILQPGNFGVPSAEDLRGSLRHITGDALEVGLPTGVGADLLVSASLSPYVPDPLRLIAHMYNQLKPGGILLTTVTTEIYDADRDWGAARSVTQTMVEDLRGLGIEVESAEGYKTLAIRRKDARPLEVVALQVLNSYEVVDLLFRAFGRFVTIYRTSPTGAVRWIHLA